MPPRAEGSFHARPSSTQGPGPHHGRRCRRQPHQEFADPGRGRDVWPPQRTRDDAAHRGRGDDGRQQRRPHPRDARGRRRLRHPRRSDPAALRPAHGLPLGPAHPRPPRAGRRPRRRGVRPGHRPGRASAWRPPARGPPTSSRRSPTPTWTPSPWWRSPVRWRAPRSGPTPSRRRTSPASPCRSPSTTTSSRTRRRSRGCWPRPSTSPAPAAPVPSSSTSRRTRCRPGPGT